MIKTDKKNYGEQKPKLIQNKYKIELYYFNDVTLNELQ